MCRLLAMTSNVKTNLHFSFNQLSKIAKDRSHEDGWGIVWLDENNCFELHKGFLPIWRSRAARRHIRDAESNLIVVHARKSKRNDASRQRSHPFKHVALGREWIFAHNGEVKCPEPLGRKMRKHRPRSDIDSEKFFCYLLNIMEKFNGDKNLNEKNLVRKALQEALKKTTIISALNFILVSQKNLFVFRYCKEKPDYYSIWHLARSSKSNKGSELDKRKGEWAIVFSSQPLSKDEKWLLLKNPQLLVVPIGFPKKLELLSIKI